MFFHRPHGKSERHVPINRLLGASSAAILAIACLASDSNAATVLAGPFINPANGHAYHFLSADTWENSQSAAVGLGGHLVTINDLAEQTWVFATFGTILGSDRNLWIGLTDKSSEGTFSWISGEPVTFTNWATGEPSNNLQGQPESYVHIWRPNPPSLPQLRQPGTWNDIVNDPSPYFAILDIAPIHGVVEVVPEPGAWMFLPLAVMASLLRRKR